LEWRKIKIIAVKCKVYDYYFISSTCLIAKKFKILEEINEKTT